MFVCSQTNIVISQQMFERISVRHHYRDSSSLQWNQGHSCMQCQKHFRVELSLSLLTVNIPLKNINIQYYTIHQNDYFDVLCNIELIPIQI